MINYLTQGDTQPVVFENFTDVDGGAIITSTVASVAFSLRHQSTGTGTVIVNAAACSITSGAGASLVCQWAPGPTDLDTPGRYEGELRITYANGKVKRFPDEAGTFLFVVRPKVT